MPKLSLILSANTIEGAAQKKPSTKRVVLSIALILAQVGAVGDEAIAREDHGQSQAARKRVASSPATAKAASRM